MAVERGRRKEAKELFLEVINEGLISSCISNLESNQMSHLLAHDCLVGTQVGVGGVWVCLDDAWRVEAG